jgi:superfamily I DNA/RNA helicase
MGWLVPFSELTDAQRRAVLLSPELHRVFAGPPGSGKTMVLLHRAANLRDAFDIEPARLRIFVFTNTLKSYLRSELGLLRLPGFCVSTFDGWCLRFFHAVVRGRVPMDGGETDYPRLRAATAAWQRLLFVGIARARRWVFLSTQSTSTDVYGPLQRLLGPEATGK